MDDQPQFIQPLPVGDRLGETGHPVWTALLAHPPLAGIGEQRVHHAKANALPIVLGGAPEERTKRQTDEAQCPENSDEFGAQVHRSVLCVKEQLMK